jgi:hypothetical protein
MFPTSSDTVASRPFHGSRWKDDEEAVALRRDLHPAVALEGIAQRSIVRAQDVRIALAELVEQPSRALDVREEERERSGRTGSRPCLSAAAQ